METDNRPLILTAELDAASFEWFDALRRRHFPVARNQVPAHLTLFHALPGDALHQIVERLSAATADMPPLDARVSGLRFLGRGVAYVISSPGLERLRAELVEMWRDRLAPQDRASFRAHVTIQNKADPADARALHDQLLHGFQPFDARLEALRLWRYLGGPWAAEGRFPFAAGEPLGE